MSEATLTKKLALEECEKLWLWLYKHPSKEYKHNWPEWSRYIKTYGRIKQLCPCCHVTKPDLDGWAATDCSKCPLETFWTKHKNLDYKDTCPCIESDSPFDKWDKAKTSKTRKKYAKIIADECTRLLKGKGQQTSIYKGKRYRLYCGCNSKKKITPYRLDNEKYDLAFPPMSTCAECDYMPWIRLGKKEKV